MLGTPRLKTTRVGIDSRTGEPVDMSFDSYYDLAKFVRAKRSTAGGLIPHGLNYSPHFMTMKELPTSLTFTTSTQYSGVGTRTVRIPTGVTSIKVKLWGGGGGGGGIVTNNVKGSGGGGAGGQYAEKTINVTAGQTYAVVVGAGGIGSRYNGGSGGDSTFGSNVVVAKGGAGGLKYESGGSGGSGSSAGGVGDTVYRGGNGNGLHTDGSGYDTGGEGGGGAGTTGNGGDAQGNSYPDPGGLGTSEGGGNGAPGFPTSGNGLNGYSAGGGGGGGCNLSTIYTTDRYGGNGGAGKAIIEYNFSLTKDKAMANRRSSYDSVNSSNISAVKGSFIPDFHGVPYVYMDDEAVWGYSFLDPILAIPEGKMGALDPKGFPVIIIGKSDSGEDYERSIHSLYDTFKVFKTGRLSISKPTTTYHNGDAGLVEVTEAKYNHGLGYIPMFAPFVDHQISIPVYNQWLGQWYGRGDWATGSKYLLNEIVVHPTNRNTYKCIKTHTSDSTNKPVDGVDWEIYWEIETDNPDPWATGISYVVDDNVIALNYGSWNEYKCILAHTSSASDRPTDGANWTTYWVNVPPTPTTSQSLVLNDLEDVKYIFGGVEVFNDYHVEYYATEQDLILRLIRVTYDWEGFFPSGFGSNDAVIATDVAVDYTIFYNRADEEFNKRG